MCLDYKSGFSRKLWNGTAASSKHTRSTYKSRAVVSNHGNRIRPTLVGQTLLKNILNEVGMQWTNMLVAFPCKTSCLINATPHASVVHILGSMKSAPHSHCTTQDISSFLVLLLSYLYVCWKISSYPWISIGAYFSCMSWVNKLGYWLGCWADLIA